MKASFVKQENKCVVCSGRKDLGGRLILRKSKYKRGDLYYTCSRFPQCNYRCSESSKNRGMGPKHYE